MISEKLMQALNDQINYEFYSANIYLAMAAFCAHEDLDGFANFFKVQAEEEKFHAMKFFDYVVEMGGRVTMSALDEPQNEYTSMLDAFKKGLEHEKLVTERIYKLTDLSMEEREHATISFLKWFIDEQVEEESTFGSIIKKLERISDNSNALYMLDAELAQRTFTPPAQ
ncbi:ferritin [Crassaminicella profunda]|uniref:ferritin n=1 Tax=Crassaminicella profunda TaxID=1286698 RepID=UPI001CA75C35|nr:ferritin [Crassaminicella profunda]QZY57560.1 ferritin [Crassaminicella profunda]